GEKGVFVTAGESTRLATALFSRHAARRVVYPSPSARPGGFMEWLSGELARGGHDAVIATEYETQLLLVRNRGVLERCVRLPFPGAALMERVHDKAALMEYAASAGVDVPLTFLPEGPGHVDELAGRLDYPVVVKPRRSSGSRGIVYARNADELRRAWRTVNSRHPLPMVQEYVPTVAGGARGVGVVYNFDSEPRAAFAYRRLREYPVSGGPSTLRESIDDRGLVERALFLMNRLGWVGPAMVEFRMDARDGRPKLLEINPRLWGSLQLAVLSGVDVPWMLARLAVDGDVEPVMDYRAGVRCRWLVPGDLMHLLTNPAWPSVLKDFFRRTDGDDIISASDPWPLLGRACSAVALLYSKELRSVVFR
ncbi:MAG TPA: ATP-grasp domain-containing protein, partial [Deltaproteobacteria bacterium]|nr:ATP-grasp domain-containing protein [Deltaproteobacteria bacterium]